MRVYGGFPLLRIRANVNISSFWVVNGKMISIPVLCLRSYLIPKRFTETGVAATDPYGSCNQKTAEGQFPGARLRIDVFSPNQLRKYGL